MVVRPTRYWDNK